MDTIEINGSILRVVMQERNISRDKLADLVGVTGRTVWNWIWDEFDPKEENFYKLCEVLKVSPRLLACSSADLVERGRTSRILRFHAKELMGTNDDPTYAETQLIHQDLMAEADGESAEEETKVGEITIPSSPKPHSDPKSVDSGSDVESSTRNNGVGDSGEREKPSDATEVVSTALSDS